MGKVRPSVAVIEAIAEAEGISPTELTPPTYALLRDVIDPTALDMLCTDTSRETPLTIEFCYNGYTVSVTDTGDVSIEKLGTDCSQVPER